MQTVIKKPNDSITLHARNEAVQAKSFWSRDDTKFMIVSPFLVGAAIFCPKKWWNQSARLIETINKQFDKHEGSAPSAPAVCESLGVAQDRLRQIIARSRVNRTEHLIHVIYSLLRKNWRPPVEIIGRQYLDEALAHGKGAVLWVAHFSFASLFTKMALSEAGYKISHVSRPEHGVSKSRFGIRYLNSFRQTAENRYLHSRIVHLRYNPEATKEAAFAVLRGNELLSVTVGAWEGRHLATGELLGSSYTVSTGAPGFAFATGAKLLSVLTTRDPSSGDYHVTIGAPLGESARSTLAEFVCASTRELFCRHTIAIQQMPEQWRGWNKLLSSSQ
jgi:lauroyl/myristoyl acyltransferase